ncbi:MAG TPA: SdpI family protein [Labilithrix sp.]
MKRMDGISIGALGLSAVATALVYERLPERIATHFDLHGQPDGWMARPIGAWFLPVFGLVIWAIVRYARELLPRREKERLDAGKAALVSSFTAIFLAALQIVVIGYALSPSMSVLRPIWAIAGVMFVALGLVLPRVKRNAIVGIRTPWTLSNDENWARTQRVGGYAMVIGGVLAAISGMSGGAAGTIVALVCLIGSAIVPVVYSLVLARRIDQA